MTWNPKKLYTPQTLTYIEPPNRACEADFSFLCDCHITCFSISSRTMLRKGGNLVAVSYWYSMTGRKPTVTQLPSNDKHIQHLRKWMELVRCIRTHRSWTKTHRIMAKMNQTRMVTFPERCSLALVSLLLLLLLDIEITVSPNHEKKDRCVKSLHKHVPNMNNKYHQAIIIAETREQFHICQVRCFSAPSKKNRAASPPWWLNFLAFFTGQHARNISAKS